MNASDYVSQIEFFDKLTDDEKRLVKENVSIRSYNADEVIHSHNGQCVGLIYVISGGIRVSVISEEGRVLTLYKLGAGDTCVISAACVLREITLESAMTAIGDTSVLILNSRTVSAIVKQNTEIRCYCYEIATARFSAAMFVLQEIILTRFDVRLARFLLESTRRAGSNALTMTQEEIASEVNSAREVVARMLRQFVLEELVELKRGTVIIKDPVRLESLAGCE